MAAKRSVVKARSNQAKDRQIMEYLGTAIYDSARGVWLGTTRTDLRAVRFDWPNKLQLHVLRKFNATHDAWP